MAPQAYGALVYYSYILVAKGSRFSSFEELRGKRFAFTDPLSNTGKLVPTYMLAKMNETPEKFFKDITDIVKSIVLFSVGVLLLGITGSLVFSRAITQPLLMLASAAEAF